MSVVQGLQDVMDWLAEEVCPKVTLKVPPDPGTPDTAPYEYRTGHPVVHGMYWPVGPRNCPPEVPYTHPGVMVQLRDGEDRLPEMNARLRLRLYLGAWNNGRHPQDTWTPDGAGPTLPDGHSAGYGPYVRDDGEGFDPIYEDGWRDCWNFLDVVRHEIANAGAIGHLVVDRTEPVTYAPYQENGAVINTYPFWFATVDFATLEAQPGAVSLTEYL